MTIRKTAFSILCLGLSSLAWAQPASTQPDWGPKHLPESTQFYFEYQPQIRLSQGPSVSGRLLRSPYFRVLSSAIGVTSEISRDLQNFPLWDGRVLVASTREGEFSPFELYRKASIQESRLSEMRFAAEMAFEGVNQYRKYVKKFPKTVEDLAREEHFDPDLIPANVTLELGREGKTMWVVARSREEGKEELQVRWPEVKASQPASPVEYGGFLWGMGCSQESELRRWLERWDGKLEELSFRDDHWVFRWEGRDVHLFVHRGWIYVSNLEKLVRPFLAASSGARSLAENPRFAEQFRRLKEVDTDSWLFLDIQDLLTTSPELFKEMGVSQERVLLRSLGMASVSRLDAQGNLEAHTQGFLHWDGVQNVTLGPPSAATLGNRIPLGAENVYWMDLAGWVRIADRLTGELPAGSEALKALWSATEEHLGLTLARETVSGGAQLFLYTEIADTYAAQLEAILDLIKVFTQAASQESNPAEAETEGNDDWLEKIPVLAVLEVSDSKLNQQVQDWFKNRLGSQRTTEKAEGSSYLLSKDKRLAFGSFQGTQIWACGSTYRLLLPVLQAISGTRPGLSTSPGYQRFVQGRQGELLAFFHGKVDREYSILKGLLLYLGSDFRPEAEILGRLRDYYLDLEVVPGGIRLRASLFSEGVKPPIPEER